MKTKNSKSLIIIPFVSIAVFLLLMFGAGYAFFTSSSSMNTATYNLSLPARTSLSCDKSDVAVVIPYGSMLQNRNETIAGSGNMSVTCTCSGAGTCHWNMNFGSVLGSTAYVPTQGYNNEFTVSLVSSSNACTSVPETNITSGIIINCNLDAGNSVTFTANLTFYNRNANQNDHADKIYKYQLRAEDATFN